MDYSVMSLIELKQHAKLRKIKQYYIRPHHELVELLSMTELPESFRIEKLTIQTLREQAKDRGIRGLWKLSRKQLVDLLYPQNTYKTAPNKYQKDEGNADEHDDPEQHDSE